MRFKRTLSTFLSLMLLLTVPLVWYAKPAEATIRIVPDSYPTIQAAINAASNGDTIEVRSGTYIEPIVVNKSVTLKGDYTGVVHPRNPLTTIIDGNKTDNAVELNITGAYISSFTIRNAGTNLYGVYSGSFNSHTIENNIITACSTGIYLFRSNNTNIRNNRIILDSGINGISLTNCKVVTARGNIISGCLNGIRLLTSTGNYLTNNTVSETSYGIYIDTSSPGNTVEYNKVESQSACIYIGGSDNTVIIHNIVSEADEGIYLYNSKYCTIEYNVASSCSKGIRMYTGSNYNDIFNNEASKNGWGIQLVQANYNDFVGNWLEKNTYGIAMPSSTGEKFYYNNFINNTVQIAPEGTNTYNDGAGKGNHWSDYTGQDTNGDGVGDTEVPHLVLDQYPLMEPWSKHDIKLASVTFSATEVNVGTNVTITVVVKNEGKGGQSETFNVTVKDGNDLIEARKVTNLASGTQTTLTFYWDTTYVNAPFNHKISVEAVLLPDELDYTDNLFIGYIKVVRPSGPWWYIPGNYQIHVQPGSSREITLSIAYHDLEGGENLTIAPIGKTTVYQLWDRYNISFARPAGGKAHLVMPKASFLSRPFYLRPVTIGIFTVYTWGQLILPKDGNGTLALQDNILDVDMSVKVTGKGNGDYSSITRTIGDGTKDPAGSLMMDMPLQLKVYVGKSATDPTWIDDLTTIDFPVWLTTGRINVTIDDSKGPFPHGTDSMNGYTESSQGRLLDPYNGSITVVACGGGLDLFFELLGANLYNDFMFKEVEVLAQTVFTDATASPNEIFENETVSISGTGFNQLFYSMNVTVTVYAIDDPIIINVTTFKNVNPLDIINLSTVWNTTIPYAFPGHYTIMIEAKQEIQVGTKTVTNIDRWVAGTLFIRIAGDMDGDGAVGKYDLGLFAEAYGTKKGDPKYNPLADFNRNGYVEYFDLGTFAVNYRRESK